MKMSKITATLLLVSLMLPVSGLARKHHHNSAAQQTTASTSLQVVYNVKTGKIHRPGCSAANRCTRNCIETTLAEALASGGVNCKICGGVSK